MKLGRPCTDWVTPAFNDWLVSPPMYVCLYSTGTLSYHLWNQELDCIILLGSDEATKRAQMAGISDLLSICW